MALGIDTGGLSLSELKQVRFTQAFDDTTMATAFRFLNPKCVLKLMTLLDVGPERLLRVLLKAVDEFREGARVSGYS